MSLSDNGIFKAFWGLFLFETGFTPMLLMLSYTTNIKLTFLFKIASLLSFAFICLYHVKNSISWTTFNRVITVFFVFSLCYGLIFNISEFDSKVFPAIYTFLMPILSISFGRHFASKYSEKLHDITIKYFGYGLKMVVIVLLAYFVLHYGLNLIQYFGFGTKADYLGAYVLGQGGVASFLVLFVLVLGSGKRATTLNMLVLALTFLSAYLLKRKLKNQLIIAGLIISSLSLGIYAYNNDYLRRFELVTEVDFTNERSIYLATSGRSVEIFGIIEHIKKSPYKLWLGSGIGAKYEVRNTFFGFLKISRKHYSHLSPLAYIFLAGLPFTVFMYAYFTRLFVALWAHRTNMYVLLFTVMVFGGSFGANLFIDAKIWMVIGIITYMKDHLNPNLPVLKLSS